jgi:hypothetical protein
MDGAAYSVVVCAYIGLRSTIAPAYYEDGEMDELLE